MITLNLPSESLSFTVGKAVLSGHLADPYWQNTYDEGRNPGLGWALEVSPAESGDTFPPQFTCDSVIFPVRRWMGLPGTIVHFKAPYDLFNSGRAYCVTKEWDELPYATLEILERNGNTFQIDWSGVFEFFGTETNFIPFHIRTQATFSYIQFWGSEKDTNETIAERLSLYVDARDFTQHPLQPLSEYESGVKNCYCNFEPKT